MIIIDTIIFTIIIKFRINRAHLVSNKQKVQSCVALELSPGPDLRTYFDLRTECLCKQKIQETCSTSKSKICTATPTAPEDGIH